MVTIYTPYTSTVAGSAIEEKVAEKESAAQHTTLSEAFLNMRRNLREELRDAVNAEWVVEDKDNSNIIEIKDKNYDT